MHHLISGINCFTHFVSHVLIYLLLTHHTTMIILLRQCHLHHSCHPSPHHSFTPISKLFFSQILSSIDIWHPFGLTPRLFGPSHGFYVYSLSIFFLCFSFHYYSLFLTWSFFSYLSCIYFSHFSNFVSFTYNTISILSISHFIFLSNISVLFSLCARLNWQCVCQFLSANFSLYCIVLYCIREMRHPLLHHLHVHIYRNVKHAEHLYKNIYTCNTSVTWSFGALFNFIERIKSPCSLTAVAKPSTFASAIFNKNKQIPA